MRKTAGACFALTCAAAALSSTRAEAAWPTIEEVVARSRANSLTVIEAQGAVRTATAAGVGARISRFNNPYLEIFVDRSPQTTQGGVTVQANLWLPIELHSQRPTRIAEATEFLKWRNVEYAEAQARSMGEAIAVYGDVIVASARLAQAQRAEAEARAEAEYFGRRVQAADATLYDKSLAENELARWVQARVEAQLALATGRARLAQLTGVEIDAPGQQAAEIPRMRQAFNPEMAAQAAEKSPTVLSLGAEAKYWDASRERSEAERNNPISFIISVGRGDQAEPRFGGGIAWTFPIIRRNEGEIARAQAEEQRALSLRTSVRGVVQSRIRSSYDIYHAAKNAVEALDSTGLPAARRVVEAATEANRAGKVELLQVFIAKRELALANARRLDLVAVAWRTYGELAALRGDLP
jgi:cobalt-zinc-cadmium efflux system outer membrane protein